MYTLLINVRQYPSGVMAVEPEPRLNVSYPLIKTALFKQYETVSSMAQRNNDIWHRCSPTHVLKSASLVTLAKGYIWTEAENRD